MRLLLCLLTLLFGIISFSTAESHKTPVLELTGKAIPPNGLSFEPEQFRVWLANSSETFPSQVTIDETNQFTASFEAAPAGKYTLYLGVFLLEENAQIAKAFQHGFTVKDRNNAPIELGEVEMVTKPYLPNGSVAPPFEMKTLRNETLKLSDYKGKYVILDFWASWCGMCKAQKSKLIDLYKKYHKDHGLEIIGLSLDTNMAMLNTYVKENAVPWQQIVIGGFDHHLIKDYSIIAIPYTILVGPDGKVVRKDLNGESGIINFLENTFKK